MWILHFLSDAFILWFCNILLLVGVVLTFAGFYAHRIPLVWQYQLPFKVLGIALLVLGVYFRGGYAVEEAWRERVREVEAKLAEAEKQATDANTKLEAKSQTKVKVIKEKAVIVKQYIDREVTKYDSQCVIPQPFIKAHNDAAEAPKK
jgi:hypothetical protein